MVFVLRLVVVGLLIGWFARFLYPGPVHLGWIATVLLGLGGSLAGGFLATFFRGRNRAAEPAGCLGSILGAMLLIFLGRLFHLF